METIRCHTGALLLFLRWKNKEAMAPPTGSSWFGEDDVPIQRWLRSNAGALGIRWRGGLTNLSGRGVTTEPLPSYTVAQTSP